MGTHSSRLLLLTVMLLLTSSCTLKQMAQEGVKAAISGDPKRAHEASLRATAERKKVEYVADPSRLVEDARLMKREFDKVMGLLAKAAGREWGEKEARLPTKKEYVKYVQNYKSRAIVDFDHLNVTVETLMTERVEESLQNAIVTTLLTPDDPRAVDLFSDKGVELKGRPYLDGLVLDQRGNPIRSPEQATAFAQFLVKNRLKERVVATGAEQRTVHYAEFPLVKNFASRKAQELKPIVARYAQRMKVSESLIFAIIRTESNFNPFAVSSAPAYGLMQLVPTSGGRDAYRRLKGRDEIPSKDYLFVPENNIELGTAYVAALRDDYFASVDHPVSREYCVISGYNTGTGNVLRAFSNNRQEAVDLINSLDPPAVYDKLRRGLPYEETRRYLVKVVGFRREFVSDQ